MASTTFHIWQSLVEEAGYKVSDIPTTWDAFIDFFLPMQAKLRSQGMRHVYVLGVEVSTNGNDPLATFNAHLIANGGKDLITPDGRLHADDPRVREAVIRTLRRHKHWRFDAQKRACGISRLRPGRTRRSL